MKKSLLSSAIAIAAFLAPVSAYAQELWIPCQGLPGCSPGWTEHFSGVLALLLVRLPTYVYALAVLIIAYGGFEILMSAGESERITKGKNAIIWSVIGIFVMNFASQLVSFVILEANSRVPGQDLVISIIKTLGTSIFDLLYIAILGVAVFCGMRIVMSFGKEEEAKKGKMGLFWCAVGAIIINLAEAIAHAFLTL